MSKKALDLDKIEIRKKLVVNATERQLAEVKNLITSLANERPVKAISDDTYELFPQQVDYESPKLLTKITLGDLSKESTESEKITDFENSDKFYKEAKREKGFKIIVDEFSDARNTKLYEGFNKIEKKWRLFVIKNLGLNFIKNAPNPENYRKVTYDHKIAQYVLSELFEISLFQPASDNYIRGRWNRSNKTEDDVIRLARLKIIDEFNFPLSAEDINLLKQARNRCMHFRVITVQEYSQAVDKINLYLKFEAQRKFAQLFTASIEPMIESVRKISDSITPFQNSIKNTDKTLLDLSKFENLFKK